MTQAAVTVPQSGSRGISARHAVLATMLAMVAGFVDAAGYLMLSHVYTANMSGNSVLLGINALGDAGSTAALHAYTIGMFLIGLLASGMVIEIGLRYRFRRMFAAAMALEVVCLGVALAIGVWLLHGLGGGEGQPRGGWPLYLMIALFTVAMGTQNTSLRMAGVVTLFTTHVTGTITKFSEDTVQYVFARIDRRRGIEQTHSGSKPPPRLDIVLLSAALWLAFLAGAISAGYVVPQFGVLVLLAPIGIVSVIGAIDCIRPLAAVEARDV